MTPLLSTPMHLRNIAYALRAGAIDPAQAADALEMLAKNLEVEQHTSHTEMSKSAEGGKS